MSCFIQQQVNKSKGLSPMSMMKMFMYRFQLDQTIRKRKVDNTILMGEDPNIRLDLDHGHPMDLVDLTHRDQDHAHHTEVIHHTDLVTHHIMDQVTDNNQGLAQID